jgi:hypothetical protein
MNDAESGKPLFGDFNKRRIYTRWPLEPLLLTHGLLWKTRNSAPQCLHFAVDKGIVEPGQAC